MVLASSDSDELFMGRVALPVNRRGILTPYRRPILTPPTDDQRLACPALAGVA